ncbi:MAG: 2-oxo-hept-4-ene-1,7-dioate hydratase [Pseudomonadota bacterium]
MTLSANQVEQAAAALFDAEQSGIQAGMLTQQYPDMSMEDAYAVQAALVERKRASGLEIRGWKIGLTSKAMQYALNIDIPDSGILFDNMFFENGATVENGRFIQPRIEAEIAFVLKEPIKGPNVSREQVIQATDHVVASLEILDTRIVRVDPTSGTTRKIFDTIADNAANAGIVLGDQQHSIDDIDLRWVGAIVSRNGEVEETGLGAGVLNDPVTGIVWLANRLSVYEQSLSAGDTVLSGSFIRPIEATPGSIIEADFGSFGTVRCNFE